MKRNDKKLFTLISRNSFEHHPDHLIVAAIEDAAQSLATTDFRSTTETKFGKLTRFWKYYVSAGLDLDYHRMNCSLTGLGEFDNAGIHEAFLSNLYATPQVDYERNGWRASFTMPLKWLHYSVAGQHDYINASPRLYLKRQALGQVRFLGFCRLPSRLAETISEHNCAGTFRLPQSVHSRKPRQILARRCGNNLLPLSESVEVSVFQSLGNL